MTTRGRSGAGGERRTILITGCSSGIGRDAALTLAARGWRVFAAVRQAHDREALAAAGLEPVLLDYGDTDSVRAAMVEVLARSDGRLDALFNNGAYSQLGAVEDLSVAALRRQFEINLFGWHELTRLAVPAMRQAGRGRIVHTSSVLGYVSAPYRGAYAASKFALEALSDALRMELAGSGVHVVLIEPGPVRTRLLENALPQVAAHVDVDRSVHAPVYRARLATLLGGGRLGDRLAVPPAAVTRCLIAALESRRPRARYRVTLPAKAAWLARRALPTRWLDIILSRQ